MLPLMMQSGEGAPSLAERGSNKDCALIGTLKAPRMMVLLFRCRQSHGAINAPCHNPRWCVRASASAWTYTMEYLTYASAQPSCTSHLFKSSPARLHLA